GSSISPGRRRRFTSNVLVVAEIALSLILLVSAGLLLKDFARLRNVDIGVRRDGVWTAAVQLPEANYKTERQQYDFSQALLERSRRIGGVDSVALSDHLPVEGGSHPEARAGGLRRVRRSVAPVSDSAHVLAGIRRDGAGAARAGTDRFEPAALQRSIDGRGGGQPGAGPAISQSAGGLFRGAG